MNSRRSPQCRLGFFCCSWKCSFVATLSPFAVNLLKKKEKKKKELLENNSWTWGEGLRDGGLGGTWLAGAESAVIWERPVSGWAALAVHGDVSQQQPSVSETRSRASFPPPHPSDSSPLCIVYKYQYIYCFLYFNPAVYMLNSGGQGLFFFFNVSGLFLWELAE